MPLFQDKEFTFEAPENWSNHSVVVFACAADEPREANPNIVVTRERIKSGDSLRVHAEKQLLKLARLLKDFDIVESRSGECCGLPSIFFRYRWASHVGELEQTITLVEKGVDPDRIALAFATTTPTAKASALEPIFQAVLESVRLVGSAPASTMRPPAPSARQPHDAAPVIPIPLIPMPGVRRRA
jgi:hypothetical protein